MSPTRHSIMNHCVKVESVTYQDKVNKLKAIEHKMKTQEISCFKYNHSPGVLTQAGVTSFQSKLVLFEDGSQLLIKNIKPTENL